MFDSSNIKEQAKKMSQMSDDDLRRATNSMPNMPGMPPGGLSPEMLKNYSNLIGNMDESQLNDMANMAKKMGYGPGNMPGMGANPYMNYPGAYNQPTQASKIPKPTKKPEEDPFSKPEEQRQFDKVNEMKNKANDLFKENSLDKASERYYEAINTIRTTECLKNSNQGKQLEINCRLNLAL